MPCTAEHFRTIKPQVPVLIAAGGMLGLVAFSLPGARQEMGGLLILGALFGTVLYATAFGFAAAYRDLLVRREVTGMQAQLLMLAVATVLFAPVLAVGSALGQPIVGALAPVGISVAAGAFAFGIGMQLAGACGSGALYTSGGGSTRMLFVLAALCAGSFLASLHLPWWTTLPAREAISLGSVLGWPGAVTLQLGMLGLAWIVLGWIARRGPQPSPAGTRRRRQLLSGAVLLAVLGYLTLVVAGHPWSITWAFTLWGAKAAVLLGWDPGQSEFWRGAFQAAALSNSVFEDVTSVMNMGIALGALAAAGSRGRFAPRLAVSMRSLAGAILGGLAMGYGARIAFGCNIGAFFSGVASTSLHGWLWIAAALPGSWVGIRLRPLFIPAN
jgi:uncharacterized protein